MDECVQVFTTASSKEEASTIANLVVEKKLAACAQVLGPIASTYWWQGKIAKAEEWLCIIKSTSKLYKQLESAICSIHSYEVPEITAVPITKGSKDYLSWLERAVKE